MGFARFFASTAGRWLRALVGLVLIAGVLAGWPLWLGVVGLFFVVVGVANICVLAPLFGGPLNGRKIAGS
ncbi:MAG TPA: YgaP-like transmembrane domain [Bacillota bacterium]|nr:YgaP-like transmembrane domain [Bacillota bacterium]